VPAAQAAEQAFYGQQPAPGEQPLTLAGTCYPTPSMLFFLSSDVLFPGELLSIIFLI
jgi:hypothetical protein